MSHSHNSLQFFPKENLKIQLLNKCAEIIRPVKINEKFEVEGFEIKVLNHFASSDGNMSDLFLCDKKPIDSKNNQTETVLLKQLRMSDDQIRKMADSLNRNELKTIKTEKGFNDLVLFKTHQVLKSFKAVKKEGKIARKVYGKDFILSHNNTRLIMPFLSGDKLFSEKNSACIEEMNLVERIELLSKIVNQVTRLHEMKIGHFDLKPENILFNPETGEIFIVDFGTAEILKDFNEIVSKVMGTPEYMGPESGRFCLGLKTDDYSIGRIINEILVEKIIPKKEILSSSFQELKNIVQAFAYRLQGKNPAGLCSMEQKELAILSPAISIKDTNYFNEIYLKFRPEHTELKLFFNCLNQYINKLKNPASFLERFDELLSLKEQLEELAYPNISFNVNLKNENSDLEVRDFTRRSKQLEKKASQETSELKVTSPSLQHQKKLFIKIPHSQMPIKNLFSASNSGMSTSASDFRPSDISDIKSVSSGYSSHNIFSPHFPPTLGESLEEEVGTPRINKTTSIGIDQEADSSTPKADR